MTFMQQAGCVLLLAHLQIPVAEAQTRQKDSTMPDTARAREIGVEPGVFEPGPLNAITDVAGVLVGQVTRIEGDSTRTGVTAIRAHAGNLFQDKVPAGLAVANGFGKLAGSTQLAELGEIETPIVLTNTLAVGRAMEAVVDWTLRQPGNAQVKSVNAVVGETNDGMLNDIRGRGVTGDDVLAAIEQGRGGPVEEGTVGAGTGTVAFGWKGGIGTSSRVLPDSMGRYTVGVLVQSNFGGMLRMDGVPISELFGRNLLQEHGSVRADGSIMIVVATDAPLSDRNLTRLARRAFAGVARTGAAFSNGSGDYAIAFSTAEAVRRTPARRSDVADLREIPNDGMTPLFVAVAEATEEAIYNSLLMATSVGSTDPATGDRVHVEALDVERVRAALAAARAAKLSGD
jgi:D-aminopeptidase